MIITILSQHDKRLLYCNLCSLGGNSCLLLFKLKFWLELPHNLKLTLKLYCYLPELFNIISLPVVWSDWTMRLQYRNYRRSRCMASSLRGYMLVQNNCIKLRWSTVATIDMRLKEGGSCAPFAERWEPLLIQCGLRRCLLPYQVTSSSIQPFGHNSVGCHSPHRNISTNYYLVVEMHTLTVRSDDGRYLLN